VHPVFTRKFLADTKGLFWFYLLLPIPQTVRFVHYEAEYLKNVLQHVSGQKLGEKTQIDLTQCTPVFARKFLANTKGLLWFHPLLPLLQTVRIVQYEAEYLKNVLQCVGEEKFIEKTQLDFTQCTPVFARKFLADTKGLLWFHPLLPLLQTVRIV
jgi:hypothetical protein